MPSPTILDFRILPSAQEGRAFDCSWDVISSGFQPSYSIEYSENGTGPWALAHGPVQATYASGVLGREYSTLERMWLRLKVSGGGADYYTPPSRPSEKLDRRSYLLLRKALRNFNLRLSRVGGTRTFLVKRRITGEPCRACSSGILSTTPVSPNCRQCYGTGYVGGYLPPIGMLADWSGGARPSGGGKKSQEGIDRTERRNIVAYPFPQASMGDLIASGDGNLYEVESPRYESWRGHRLNQIIPAVLLERKDPAYKIPIDYAGSV